MTIDEALKKLKTSPFRARFHLSAKEKEYVREKGLETIAEHARDFIRNRLAPAQIANDGKQTPMRGHPVFVAQHATACCCRGCMQKWYGVPKNRVLTEKEQSGILKLIMMWIMREMQDENL